MFEETETVLDKMIAFKYEHKRNGGKMCLGVNNATKCDKNLNLLTPAGTNNGANDRRCLFRKIIV